MILEISSSDSVDVQILIGLYSKIFHNRLSVQALGIYFIIGVIAICRSKNGKKINAVKSSLYITIS